VFIGDRAVLPWKLIKKWWICRTDEDNCSKLA